MVGSEEMGAEPASRGRERAVESTRGKRGQIREESRSRVGELELSEPHVKGHCGSLSGKVTQSGV